MTGIESNPWSDNHEPLLTQFIENPSSRIIFIFIDPRNGLTVSNTLPAFEIEELNFFIKAEESVVNAENFNDLIHFGSLRVGYAESLLRLLKYHFGPTVFTNQSWPDGIRNDFSGQIHKVMAYLTDAQYRTAGHTVLYVPDEGPVMEAPEAHKNKELVQRLEGEGLIRCKH